MSDEFLNSTINYTCMTFAFAADNEARRVIEKRDRVKISYMHKLR